MDRSDHSEMHFRRYIPRSLGGIVSAIWEQKANRPMRWQILPSGFTELIVRLSPPPTVVPFDSMKLDINPTVYPSFLSGLHAKSIRLQFAVFHFMGIQLHPLAVRAVFGFPTSEVCDTAVEGTTAHRTLLHVEERLSELPGFRERAAWLESWILNGLHESPELLMMRDIAGFVNRELPRLGTNGGTIESHLGFSRAHTHRMFHEWFGMAPGRYLRFRKYIRGLELMHTSAASLTDISFRAGFFDQPHFTRTFREFTDMTPRAYRRRMSDHFGQLPFE